MKKILAFVLVAMLALTVFGSALATDTVTYYLRGGTATYEPYLYEGLVGVLKIQQLADVKIDWTVVCGTGDEIQAQYLAMLSSGNYPDIIQWLHNEAYNGGVEQLYADGIIIELNDVIDKYMPNYKAFLETHTDIANTLMNDKGQYLYFTYINPLETADDLSTITYWGPMLRADWMENVGIDDTPVTIDDWTELLTAFRDMDPNGNGVQDEIPFDGGAAGYQMFMGAYDIMSGIYLDPATGKVAYGEYTQNYKEFLETMNKWYSEGLIQNLYDENGNTANWDSVNENIYADLSGGSKALSNWWEQRLPQVQQKNPNADFIEAQWPADASGHVYGGYNNVSYVDRTTTVISVDCKNVEAAARLIDTMLTDEGSLLLTWGTEDGDPINDQDWIPNLYGSYAVDENGNKYNTEYWAKKICENFYDGAFPNQYRYAMSHISFPRIGSNGYLSATREPNYVRSFTLWGSSDLSLAFPNSIVLSVDAQKAAAPQLDDINTYISEMTQKFITGEEPLTNFDNYIDQLQKMGIEDLIAAYQAAYDAYIARGK